jgi:predicted cupin superfamily sugar epimerase
LNETIQEIIDRLGLAPHPEGGFYREIYRSRLTVAHPSVPDGVDPTRATATGIYFLLPADDFSAFHRVRWTDEIWHLYAGGPLELHVIDRDGGYEKRVLTADLACGEPTSTVEAGCWQAARVAPGEEWALGGCTVAPAFEFADFEMPAADEIVRQHPLHESIIRELTKR